MKSLMEQGKLVSLTFCYLTALPAASRNQSQEGQSAVDQA